MKVYIGDILMIIYCKVTRDRIKADVYFVYKVSWTWYTQERTLEYRVLVYLFVYMKYLHYRSHPSKNTILRHFYMLCNKILILYPIQNNKVLIPILSLLLFLSGIQVQHIDLFANVKELIRKKNRLIGCHTSFLWKVIVCSRKTTYLLDHIQARNPSSFTCR